MAVVREKHSVLLQSAGRVTKKKYMAVQEHRQKKNV